MENSIEKDEEILNNIKTYMQENIDKGWHKFVYNDLGCHEKCIDIINAIETVLSELEKKEAIINEMVKHMEQDIEEMKRLFYADRLTAYGKRKLIEYYEQRIKQLEEENQLLLNSKIGVDLSFDDYIPVSLVEETIGELNKAYEDSKDENGESEYYYPDYTIRVLEGLLEKRK